MFEDLSQVADIVNRKKISDRRLRNEEMRKGMTDTGGFAQENVSQIEQAQQPTEFWGAGRKEAAVQAPDMEAVNLLGGIHELGGTRYYYGDKDTSTAQFGTEGYQTQDKGRGIYDIFGKSGNVLGQGYRDPTSTINEIKTGGQSLEEYVAANPIQYNYSPDEWGNPQIKYQYDEWGNPIYPESPAEAYNKMLYQPYRAQGRKGDLQAWEVLGGLLNGSGELKAGDYWRDFDRTGRSENITGLNTLYGSNPLIWNDKLLGYQMDMAPAKPGDYGYTNPNTLHTEDLSGKHQSSATLQRIYNNPEEWSKYGVFQPDNKFFAKAEDAANLPGWQQTEAFMDEEAKSGFLGGFGGLLGGILGFTPLAPLGYALSAMSALDSGNTMGLLGSLFSGYMGLSGADIAGASGLDEAVGGGFSGADLVDFPAPSSAIQGSLGAFAPEMMSGLSGALGAAAQGQNPLMGAAGAALGNFVGSDLGKLAYSDLGEIGSKALGGAASRGINSLFTKGDAVRGSLYGGMSGGLHGFLNSTPYGKGIMENSDSKNKQLANEITSLAKLFANRR